MFSKILCLHIIVTLYKFCKTVKTYDEMYLSPEHSLFPLSKGSVTSSLKLGSFFPFLICSELSTKLT